MTTMTGHGMLDFIGTRHGLHKSDYSFRVEQYKTKLTPVMKAVKGIMRFIKVDDGRTGF